MKKQDKEKERKFNDDFVVRTGGYETYDEDLDQLFDIFGISSSFNRAVALDLGCGTGKCSIALAKLGYEVIGVDISEKAIEVARQKAYEQDLDIIFRVEDAEALPFQDCTFDVVFCGGVLHHFPDLTKVENELHRVLKQDGNLFAYEANKSNPVTYLLFTLARLSRKFCKIGYVEREFSVNERPLSHKELETTLRICGFNNFVCASINIRNKDKDAAQVVQSKIRLILRFLSNKLLPRLCKGRHLVLSCTKKGESI